MKMNFQTAVVTLAVFGLGLSTAGAAIADETVVRETRTYHTMNPGTRLTEYRYLAHPWNESAIPVTTTSSVTLSNPVVIEKREKTFTKEVIKDFSEPVFVKTRRIVRLRPKTRVAYRAPIRRTMARATVIEKTVEKPIVVERPVVVNKTIDRVIDRPVYIDRPVETPVYRDRVIEKPVYIDREVPTPVYRDRVIEKPVYIENNPQPVIIKEKEHRHGLLHMGLF